MSLNYLEDIPAETPAFDYDLLAKALAPLLTAKRQGATVLGIHGLWGAGKTTLMNALERRVKEDVPAGKGVYISFNAWKFQDREALWRALVLHVLGSLREAAGDAKDSDNKDLKKRLDELELSLYRAFSVEEKGPWKINWKSVLVELVTILLAAVKLGFVARALKKAPGWIGLLLGGDGDEESNAKKPGGWPKLFGKAAKSKEDDKDDADEDDEKPDDHAKVEKLASVLERETVKRQIVQIQSVEQFLGAFRDLIAEFDKQGRSVFVFIDDLDRCLPEAALEIFESIKLFLDAPGCAYVVALDRGIIRKGLNVRYTRQGEAAQEQTLIDPDEYLEKTISLSFDLPRLSQNDAFALMDGVTLPLPLSDRHKALIVAGLGTTPRRIVRFMNTLAFHLSLAETAQAAGRPVNADLLAGADPEFECFLKILLLSYRYPAVFAASLEDRDLFTKLQNVANSWANSGKRAADKVARAGSLKDETVLIRTLSDKEEFWRLMAEKPNFAQAEIRTLLDGLQNWFRYQP